MSLGRPYTHADHARRCREAAQAGQVLALQRVQVLKRGVLYCARICNAWTTPTGEDLWTVETTHPECARFTVPCRLVRLCGDARCACVEGAGAEGAPLAGEGPRQGLEGVTC